MVNRTMWKGPRNFVADHPSMMRIKSSVYFQMAAIVFLTVVTVFAFLYVLSITTPRISIPNAETSGGEGVTLPIGKPLPVLSPSTGIKPLSNNSPTSTGMNVQANSSSASVTVDGTTIRLEGDGRVKKKIVKHERDGTTTVDINMHSSSSGTSHSSTEVQLESSSEVTKSTGG